MTTASCDQSHMMLLAQAAASGVREANPSSRVAQAASAHSDRASTAGIDREAKDMEPDLVQIA